MRFGPFELKPASGELRRDGATVKLPPQPLKVLVLLAENAGQLVTREEIQRQVWGSGTFVDFDKGLNFCIKQIREALGDNAQSPSYIETLPRRGYRFIAPVEDLLEAGPVDTASPDNDEARNQPTPISGEQQIDKPSQQQGEPAAHLPRRSPGSFRRRAAVVALAILLLTGSYFAWRYITRQVHPSDSRIMILVLPFENLNRDPAQDYFSDGLTEEMIAQLGRLQPERLGVIARTTALTYKNTSKDIRQIGRELGVSYVLEGSVRREGERVRITAQLIQVGDQANLWSETYERSERDVLELQSEVAGRVAQSLALELLPPSRPDMKRIRPTDPEAYDAYLKGRFLVTKDTLPDLERSITYFDQATEKDPNFAPAYAAAVDARVLLTTWKNTSTLEATSKAKADASRAVDLDPTLGEAYAALGSVNLWFEWKWSEAEANIKRAIELNPSNPNIHILYASYLISRGQTEQAVSHIKQAVELDPVSLLTTGLSAELHLTAGRYDDAIALSGRMLELEPKSPAAHWFLINAYKAKGMYQEARELILKRMSESGDRQESIDLLKQGDAKEALERMERRQFERMKESLSKGGSQNAAWVSQTFAGMGERDLAFEWLEKAYAERLPSLLFFNIDPGWNPLREDPRFTDFARRMGLMP